MYLCYIDESGDPGVNGSRHLVLVGTAIFEGKWSSLRQDLVKQLVECFDREPRESVKNPGKWHGIKSIGLDPATQQLVDSVWA